MNAQPLMKLMQVLSDEIYGFYAQGRSKVLEPNELHDLGEVAKALLVNVGFLVGDTYSASLQSKREQMHLIRDEA